MVGAAVDFVDDDGFEIDKDDAQDVLVESGFTKEGVEGIMGYIQGGRVDGR